VWELGFFFFSTRVGLLQSWGGLTPQQRPPPLPLTSPRPEGFHSPRNEKLILIHRALTQLSLRSVVCDGIAGARHRGEREKPIVPRPLHLLMSVPQSPKRPSSSAAAAANAPPLRCQTVAGSGRMGAGDGPSETATFSFPHSVLPLPDGSALVSDCGNNAMRHISVDARGRFTVQRVGARGFTWLRPRGLAQLPDGGVLVCDSGHNRIRLLAADGSVRVFAGSGRKGLVDGPAATASFDTPSGVWVCADGTVLVADTGNHCIRTISADGLVVATLAGCGKAGSMDGPAGGASFDKPSAVLALGGALGGMDGGESVVYVADAGNHCVRMIVSGVNRQNPATHTVGTLCGRAGAPGQADGPLEDARLGQPTGLAVLADGTLAVSDSVNNNIRCVNFETHTISTLAGGADRGWGLVDGPGREGRFNMPKGLSVSVAGELWVADSQNHCVRLLREDEAIRAARIALHSRSPPPTLPKPQDAASWAMSSDRQQSGRNRRATYGSPSPARRLLAWAGGGSDGGDGTPADGGASLRLLTQQPSESFSTEGFAADAQLFERDAGGKPHGGGGGEATSSSRGGWTYSGTAAVILRRCAPRAAMLSVQVHGAPTAEVSVLRPSQLMLRDTAFVVCSIDTASGSGYVGFGGNELGLRFRTTTAAASLLAACEAIVGTDGGGPGGGLGGSLEPSTSASPVRGGVGPPPQLPPRPRQSTSTSGRVSSIPSLRRPRPGAPAAADDSAASRLEQAEQDVLRLSARLAERDMEAGRLLKRLEQAQAQVRSRDAKVAELNRRLSLLQGKTKA
jgi:sugar lactone lactonase YvrE